MFSLIAFILKLLFGAILGGALAYEPGKIRSESRILYSALISLIAVSLVSISGFSSDNSAGFVLGASIFTVITAVILLTRDQNFDQRLLYIFSAVVGIICGTGHIFYGIFFTIIVYLVINMGHQLFENNDIEPDTDDTGKIKILK
ncbi:MAG: hypothetical protein GXO91_05660 [FCB group bacterium]|nr:hypothetical protein [FCB group bacterium]